MHGDLMDRLSANRLARQSDAAQEDCEAIPLLCHQPNSDLSSLGHAMFSGYRYSPTTRQPLEDGEVSLSTPGSNFRYQQLDLLTFTICT